MNYLNNYEHRKKQQHIIERTPSKFHLTIGQTQTNLSNMLAKKPRYRSPTKRIQQQQTIRAPWTWTIIQENHQVNDLIPMLLENPNPNPNK